MASHDELDEKHTRLTEWSEKHGVVINGVRPAVFPGKGLGIVAARHLKTGERIIHVPAQLLLTVDINKKKNTLLKGLSIHGQLARVLGDEMLAGSSAEHLEWLAAMPSQEEMKEYMPVFWPESEQEFLTDIAKALLSKQAAKMEADLAAVLEYRSSSGKAALSDEPEFADTFGYAWMLVNSRSFYWDYPVARTERRTPRDRQRIKSLPPDDCMALSPFMDYFNHSNAGCPVSYNTEGFSVTSDGDYMPGDEINISYGAHSNDFLLVEYGFIMDNNDADHTKLDAQLGKRFSKEQKEQLRDENLLGNYIIDRSGICHRTQCALRLLLIPFRKWERFVRGIDDGAKEQAQVDKFCATLIKEFLDDIGETRARLAVLPNSPGKDTLQKRYVQVESILEIVLKKMNTNR